MKAAWPHTTTLTINTDLIIVWELFQFFFFFLFHMGKGKNKKKDYKGGYFVLRLLIFYTTRESDTKIQCLGLG